MRTVLSWMIAVLFCVSGCGVEVNVGDEGVKVKAPGVDIDVSDEKGVNVQAPGVDVKVNDDDVKVQAPGVDVNVNDDNVEVKTPSDEKEEAGDEETSEDKDN